MHPSLAALCLIFNIHSIESKLGWYLVSYRIHMGLSCLPSSDPMMAVRMLLLFIKCLYVK